MKHKAATLLLTGGLALGFATDAHAGQATYTRECGPDGNTIVHLHATNSWTTVYVNGQQIHDTNGDGTADLTTGPGVYSIEWWGPSTDGNGVQHPELPFIPLNPEPTILTIPALTSCVPTTTQAQATTTSSPPATTALVPPSTTAPIPWTLQCPLPIFDNNVWRCPTTTTRPATTPSIDLDVPVTTVGISGSTLPATATNSALPLGGGAGVLLVTGLALVGIKRYWRVPS